MEIAKKRTLEKKGYAVGRVEQLLGVTQAEPEIIDSILHLPTDSSLRGQEGRS
jgi:hypothetical protein